MWWRRLAEIQTKHQNGKKVDLSDFEHGMVVAARRAGLSISKTADLLGFSRTTISRLYIYIFSRRFYPKQLTGYTFFLSVCVFPGTWTHNLCSANAMLYHWATGTLQRISEKEKYPVSGSCVDKNPLLMSEVRGEWAAWLEMIERQQQLK